MRKHKSIVSMRSLSRFLAVAVVGGAAAACGTDVVRFSDNPFGNPFGQSERFSDKPAPSAGGAPMQTAAMPQSATAPGAVSSAPLAPPSVASAPLPAPAASAAAAPRAVNTAVAAAPAGGGWTAKGGSTITLGQGETLKTVAGRYGVPESALRQTNNLAGTAQPAPGQKIVIPVFNAAAAPAPAQAAAPAKAQTAQAQPAAAQTRPDQAAKAQPAPAQAADRRQTAAVQPAANATPAAAPAAKPGEAPKADARTDAKTAKVDPKAAKNDAKPAVAAAEPAKPAAPETTAAIAPQSEFRWPVRGRVITGFGNKGGQQSDGIAIAVPEGTPVKAAEGGVVGYAGNELKGYGNLVLVRHDNGMVTVYAHNGELKVKRGDQVKRGQVIATSGQTGNVSSPQLKFEIRKGQTPVDPLEYLSGN